MGQNIFLESGFADEDATIMALETDVAIAIARYIRGSFAGNQNGAAKKLRIGQNEVSSLLSGNIARFSLQKLLKIARRAGLRMFMDMGDTAHGAYATSLAPSIVSSAVIVGHAEISDSLLEDEFGTFVTVSKGAGSTAKRAH